MVMMCFKKINLEKLREFVVTRQNDDGGFTFCKPIPSTLAETYFAVNILVSIGSEVPKKEKLIEFLQSRIQKEIYTLFYTLHSLKLLGEDIYDFSDFLINKLKDAVKRERRELVGNAGITATYTFEQPNVLREIYTISSLLSLYQLEVPEVVKNFVKQYRRVTRYGIGYGDKEPNLEETFYAVYVLRDDAVISFVKHFESNGGFAKHPKGFPPYLEDTYYALSIFRLLNYSYRNDKTIEYVASLQNPNGGFRRSIYGGISTLEDSYYAVECLKYFEEVI